MDCIVHGVEKSWTRLSHVRVTFTSHQISGAVLRVFITHVRSFFLSFFFFLQHTRGFIDGCTNRVTLISWEAEHLMWDLSQQPMDLLVAVQVLGSGGLLTPEHSSFNGCGPWAYSLCGM